MRPRASLSAILRIVLGALFLSSCSQLQGVEAVLEASPEEGAVPLRVEFRISGSTHGTGESGTFTLDFGDGTGSVQGDDFGVLVPHVYERVGEYQACLTVTAADGRMDVATVSVDVFESVPEGSGVGEKAYDFTALSTDGQEITLSEFRGDVVLIEFWGSWCKPCKQSMPHINAFWETYHDQGFVVLAISTDAQAEDAVAYLEANEFTGLTCIWEPGGKKTRIKQLYEVDWIPRSVVVDKTGTVRYNGHPMDLEADLIETLLAEPFDPTSR
ncbi:MAG: redoxin domain-containing protein [Candidatus Bipolaricaulota bacterium]|nr:redoxin domain-containing protein [Candidatus Bipolaricaulota bacterium]